MTVAFVSGASAIFISAVLAVHLKRRKAPKTKEPVTKKKIT